MVNVLFLSACFSFFIPTSAMPEWSFYESILLEQRTQVRELVSKCWNRFLSIVKLYANDKKSNYITWHSKAMKCKREMICCLVWKQTDSTSPFLLRFERHFYINNMELKLFLAVENSCQIWHCKVSSASKFCLHAVPVFWKF